MTRTELNALPTVNAADLRAHLVGKVNPPFMPAPGDLVALNAEGHPAMWAKTSGPGSRGAMGLVLMNARGNGYELRRAVEA